MKKQSSTSAFTLIELIVSSLLVVIVLLGVFSISTVLSNNNQDYGQRYLVKSETQATLNHMLNNASLAVGSANGNDEGVLHGNGVQADGNPGMGDANSLCIHQLAGANNNLINYTVSDIWLCYSLAANVINWCAEKYTGPGADPRGASSCSTALPVNLIVNPATGTSVPTYLGSAKSMAVTFSNTPGTQLLFSVAINNCLNPSLGTCAPAGDPANNPYVTVTGSVIPTQESN